MRPPMVEPQKPWSRQPLLRWIAHVDMDAFFASVEQLDQPHLAGKPLIVGNSPLSPDRIKAIAEEARNEARLPEFLRGVRGVVASASYEARRFGVRSAMPLARALVLCPDAVVVPGRFDRYRAVNKQLQSIWAEFSPLIEPMSLDEAYLDLTGSFLPGDSVRPLAEKLKARIWDETGLTASVGVASCKLVAKLASELDKPDGLRIVEHGDEAETLSPLNVRALPGVGPRAAERLASLGIETIGQLAAISVDALASQLGMEQAQALHRCAIGIDERPVEEPGDPKSISTETTLDEDSSQIAELHTLLVVLADQVGWSLRSKGFRARCVFIKLRLLPARRVWTANGSSFGRLITRRCTLPSAIDGGSEIGSAAVRLLNETVRSTGLGTGAELARLVGVGVSSLVRAEDLSLQLACTPMLFDGSTPEASESYDEVRSHTPLATRQGGSEKAPSIDPSMDQIRSRFGFGAISLAASLKGKDNKLNSIDNHL